MFSPGLTAYYHYRGFSSKRKTPFGWKKGPPGFGTLDLYKKPAVRAGFLQAEKLQQFRCQVRQAAAFCFGESNVPVRFLAS